MSTSDQQHKPATSLDVARRAGVSRSTVSNILNGNDARFPAQTRDRVLAAASELEYQPSLAGRSLVSGRSDTVVVLVPNTSFGSNLQDAVDQVMLETRQIGGNVVVRFASDSAEATRSSINALRPLALVDFGVLSRDDRDWLEDRGTIIVPSLDEEVGPADGGLSRLQADELLENGERALWYAAISDKRVDPFGPYRYEQLRRSCADRGLPVPGHISVPLQIDGAVAAVRAVLEGGIPAGIACYNDDVALAILAAARVLHVRVPEDISVVGVDNTALGQLWSPRLTTVDTDLRGLVNALAEDLRIRLRGPSPEDTHPERLHFTVVKGETT